MHIDIVPHPKRSWIITNFKREVVQQPRERVPEFFGFEPCRVDEIWEHHYNVVAIIHDLVRALRVGERVVC